MVIIMRSAHVARTDRIMKEPEASADHYTPTSHSQSLAHRQCSTLAKNTEHAARARAFQIKFAHNLKIVHIIYICTRKLFVSVYPSGKVCVVDGNCTL